MMERTGEIHSKKNGVPAIRISLRWNKLHIHKTTIKALNFPQYIQLLVERNKKILIIRGCKKKERDCFPVPASLFEKARSRFCLESKLFMEALRIQIGWEQGVVYRIVGKSLPQLSLVLFDLNCGELLSDLDRLEGFGRRRVQPLSETVYLDSPQKERSTLYAYLGGSPMSCVERCWYEIGKGLSN
jgi:hypothetical protein